MKKFFKLGSIFLSLLVIFYSVNRYRNYSLSLMPKEYKLVKKIFDKFSLNNDLGNRPVSIIIRAGEDMHYLMVDTGICKDKKNIEVIDLEMLIMQLSNLIYMDMRMLVPLQQEQFL